jgi:RNA polymerase sigma factor (sigma-70 family)
MNIKITTRNFELLKNHEKLIDRQTQKISKMLPTFSSEVLDLTISLERLPRGSQYQTSLVLSIPQRTITVEEIQDNPTTATVRAFTELKRRVKRFKSQLNRERLWHKTPPTASESGPTGREFESVINDNLDKIENYIRREIYHLILAGTVPPGVLEPHALVDDVFLQLTSGSDQFPVRVPLEQWMYQVARKTVQERLAELETTRNDSHIEEKAEVEDVWEDERLHFYQPDEALQVEDIIEDDASNNPEQILERDEVEKKIQQSIAGLPESFRESFVLYVLEGFTSDEIAMMTGKHPRQVIDEVENARELLRNELQA